MKFTASLTAPNQTKLGLDAASWTYRFKADGRRYTLSKRNKSADGLWQIDIVVKGQRVTRSLETTEAKLAAERAVVEFIRPARAGRWEAIEKQRANSTCASIGTILDVYDEIADGLVGAKAQRNNQGALLLVVRRGLGDDDMSAETVRGLPTAKLTGKLVADFEEWQTRTAIAAGANLESNKRTVLSFLGQGRSIFNKHFLQRYPEKGLELPDLTEFLARKTAKPARLVPVKPGKDLLARTAAEVASLRTTDRELYVVVLLALYSLRRGEIDRMAFDWAVQDEEGQWVVRVPANMAKSKAERDVPIDPAVVTELVEWRGMRGESESGFVFAAVAPGKRQPNRPHSLRCDGLFKRANAWLRSIGWTHTRMGLHALRARYLRELRKRFGLDAAQAVGGHADASTTEGYTGTPVADAGVFIPFSSLVAKAG